MDAIILAGGYGTRLQSVVSGVPKPMANVCGKPFLSYLFDYWIRQGVSKFYLLVAYLSDQIIDYYGDTYCGVTLQYIVEKDPKGTGGALKNAVNKIEGVGPFLLINGDTLFNVDLNKFLRQHIEKNAEMSIGVFKSPDHQRYDAICLDENQKIINFGENCEHNVNYVNGGIYMMNKAFLDKLALFSLDQFSFEKDYIFKSWKGGKYYGFFCDSYFIDIGIPADYENFKITKNGFK